MEGDSILTKWDIRAEKPPIFLDELSGCLDWVGIKNSQAQSSLRPWM